MLLGSARVSQGEEQQTRRQEAALRAAAVAWTFTECAERPSRAGHCPEAMDAQHGRSRLARTPHAHPLLGHCWPSSRRLGLWHRGYARHARPSR
jgi:hypothetical protein